MRTRPERIIGLSSIPLHARASISDVRSTTPRISRPLGPLRHDSDTLRSRDQADHRTRLSQEPTQILRVDEILQPPPPLTVSTEPLTRQRRIPKLTVHEHPYTGVTLQRRMRHIVPLEVLLLPRPDLRLLTSRARDPRPLVPITEAEEDVGEVLQPQHLLEATDAGEEPRQLVASLLEYQRELELREEILSPPQHIRDLPRSNIVQ